MMIAFTPSKIWLAVAVLAMIVEVIPPPTHFFFFCVALGALAASIAAFFSTASWLPWTIFTVATVALVPLLIPLARFLFTPKPHASNVDALVGEKALVLEPITPKAPGVVKVRGESWRATSDGDSFSPNEWTEVVRIEGTHVVIRRPS